jgi:hypothetical protein
MGLRASGAQDALTGFYDSAGGGDEP